MAQVKLLKQRTPQSTRVMAISKEAIKIFLCPLTKEAGKRPSKRRSPYKPIHSVNPIQQNLPGEDFHRMLGPPNHIKNKLPIGEGSNNKLKKDFT